MNYAVVAVGALIVLVICGWFGWGRGVFGGSVRTLEGREASLGYGDGLEKETSEDKRK